jgi:hypothetical protein
VLLGEWVRGRQDLANLSLIAFKEIINPALERAYASARGKFVDITAGTGAYGPMTATTTLDPFGVIPVPVARVCELTFYCDTQNIHARRSGYKLMASLIAESLPRRR